MKKLVYLLIGLFTVLIIGCKSRQAVIQPTKEIVNTVEKIVTKTERDTTFIVDSDSSFYKAWIECRDGKPVLRDPKSQAGKGKLKAPNVKLDDRGQLDIECATENLELKARISDLITELNTSSSTVEYVPFEVVKPLTKSQELFINLGKVFGVILLGFIGYGAFKLYKKTYGR